jgi:hypothetical protein
VHLPSGCSNWHSKNRKTFQRFIQFSKEFEAVVVVVLALVNKTFKGGVDGWVELRRRRPDEK